MVHEPKLVHGQMSILLFAHVLYANSTKSSMAAQFDKYCQLRQGFIDIKTSSVSPVGSVLCLRLSCAVISKCIKDILSTN